MGEAYKCAIRPGGSVACWTSDDAELETVPELCNATAVSAVSQSRCAVISDGSVRCWGSLNPSVFGQETSRRPIAVPHVTAAVDIATLASGYTCALISDGSVTCWGGGPGRGDRPGPEPSPVFEIAGAVALAGAGLEFGSDVCAVLEDRTVTCWSQATAPVPMAGVEDVVSLAHGWNHDCGLFGDGLVRCWGGNASGQLGNGTNADSETPVVVEGLSGAVQIALFDIDGRTGRSCALLDDGSAHCWGSDVGGGLGSDTPGDTNTPVRVNFP